MGVEGEPLHIALHANANPMSMSFTWTKNGLPITQSLATMEQQQQQTNKRLYSSGATLNITKLSRNDAGSYVCEAMNSQGQAMMEVQIIVECKLKLFQNY